MINENTKQNLIDELLINFNKNLSQEDVNSILETTKEFSSLISLYAKLLGVNMTKEDIESCVSAAVNKFNEPKSKAPVEKKVEHYGFEVPDTVGVNLHKIVGKYIDEVVRPECKGKVAESTVTEVYGALYRFASWMYNQN